MMSKEEFVNQVADLYTHLYDLVYLRAHPLAGVLLPDPALPAKEKAWQLHHLLLRTISELEPSPQVPVFSRPWRRHQLLVLRYTKALSQQAVMEQLGISRRHYYREHRIAMEALADILWGLSDSAAEAQRAAPPSVAEQASLSRLELLRMETARVAQANRYARVPAVLERVLPVLGRMLQQRRLVLQWTLPETLAAVSIDQSLLRQLFLSLFVYLIESTEQATIRLRGRDDEEDVRLTVLVEPPDALTPGTGAETRERLAALEEMAALSGAQVTPLCAGPAAGFEIVLPTARRTVLVVDDNSDVLELFRRYLALHRYHVATAQTAQQALTLARRLRPYAITLDLMMPDQDGWDLLQMLLNQPETRDIPILVCTVLKQKELALSLGAAAFLEKPVSEQALLSALSALG